jgi:hypothetical protein
VANQALIVTSTVFTYGDLGGAGFEVSGGAIVFGDQAGDEIDMAAGMTFAATGGGFVFSDTSGGTFGSNTTGGVGITDQSSPGMDFDEAGTGPVAMDANGGGFSFSDTAGGNFQVTTNTILASTQLCADSDNNFISTGPNCSVLVASLPAAASGNAGQVRSVSDSTTIATEGQTCAGGSTHTALAFSNGTVWKCF